MLNVTERDWRPRYVQVAEELKEQILSGDLPAGQMLPSEPELSEKYGISRTSIRNALRTLREWGLIRSEQGRGSFVRSPKTRVTRRNIERYQWEKDRVHEPEELRGATGSTEQDTGLTFQDLEFHAEYDQIPATPELAETFDIEAGTTLLRRIYWTSAKSEDAPLSMSRSYLVLSMLTDNPDLLDAKKEPWPGGTHHQLSTVGIEIDRVVDTVTARPPMPDEVEILRTDPGVSVLALRKVSYGTDGRVVELAEAAYPGDRTELVYEIPLKRWTK